MSLEMLFFKLKKIDGFYYCGAWKRSPNLNLFLGESAGERNHRGDKRKEKEETKKEKAKEEEKEEEGAFLKVSA
jgi:hypothetical protein